jgi:hypothetical protein
MAFLTISYPRVVACLKNEQERRRLWDRCTRRMRTTGLTHGQGFGSSAEDRAVDVRVPLRRAE